MDKETCLICENRLDDQSLGPIIKRPRSTGIRSLLNSAEARRDDVYFRLICHKNLLESMKHTFTYHLTCFKNYTSSQNVQCLSRANLFAVSDSSASSSVTKVTERRSLKRKHEIFDIRNMCFICRKPGTRKKKKLVPISTGTGEKTRAKVLEAASLRQDCEMTASMELYTDLFALDAKYHQSCYSHYISKRNIKYASKPQLQTQSVEIPSQENVSLDMSLETCDDSPTTDDDSFEHHQHQKILENDLHILHKASGIIRKALESSQKASNETYLTPDAITMENCEKDIPNELLYLFSWILNKDDFEAATISNEHDIAVLATCNALLTNYRKKKLNSNNHIISLCLGLQIYYTTRSKKIIDMLYQLGYSCAYDEIRTFLTNIANSNIQRSDETYVPQGLSEITNKNYIRSSIDNFDINEDTIDGKNTTHCMAMVVFQEKTERVQFNPIHRHNIRSLHPDTDYSEKLATYKKDFKRPEPISFDINYFSYDIETQSYKTSSRKDLLWNIVRSKSEKCPSWTDFNNMIADNNVPVSIIRYLPFINAPPSNYDTILTSLVQLTKIAEQLKQNHIIVTADLAIYTKAQEILWSNPGNLRDKVTMQIGGMHLVMAFIASLGTQYLL